MKKNDNKNPNDATRVIRTFLMVLIYFVMAFLIVFTKVFDNLFQNHQGLRIAFGALFFVYGIFRAYRLWRDSRRSND